MENMKALMREKIERLNKAAKAYYQDAEEIMSNFEYDKLYDELETLEKETGMILVGIIFMTLSFLLFMHEDKSKVKTPSLLKYKILPFTSISCCFIFSVSILRNISLSSFLNSNIAND